MTSCWWCGLKINDECCGALTTSLSVRHAVNRATLVVAHVQRSVGTEQNSHRSSHRSRRAGGIGRHPAGYEILDARRIVVAVQLDSNHLVTSRNAAVPGSVECDEQIALVFRREHLALVESESERRRVGLQFDFGRNRRAAVRGGTARKFQ